VLALEELEEEEDEAELSAIVTVVYVPSDRSAEQFEAYRATHHASMLAVPYGDEQVAALKKQYACCGGGEMAGLGLTARKGELPTLALVGRDGAVLKQGLEDADSKDIGCTIGKAIASRGSAAILALRS